MHHAGVMNEEIGLLEYVLYAWTICNLLVTFKQAWGIYEADATIWRYLASARTWRDIFSFSCIFVAMILRILQQRVTFVGENCSHTITSTGDTGDWKMCRPMEKSIASVIQFLYACAAITVFLRTIDAFRLFKNFGVLYITFLKMFVDVFNWIKLVALFTISFGVAFSILLPHSTYGPLWSRPFFRGLWGVLGDFDIDFVDSYEVGSLDGLLMGALTFVYMFVVTIVLINLLIAQMSARYENVMAGANEAYVLEKINLVEDAKDGKSWLPPVLKTDLRTGTFTPATTSCPPLSHAPSLTRSR